MLSHLFKLIWNKKKQNFLLMLEMLVSFAVIFAVFTLLVNYYNNYKKPMGFDYENVWTLNFTVPPEIKSTDSVQIALETFRKTIESMPEVNKLAFTSTNVPFSMNTMRWAISYKNKEVNTDFYIAEKPYKDVLNLKVLQGKWLSQEMATMKDKPVVINEVLKEKLFSTEDPVGKVISFGGVFDKNAEKVKVVGVVNNFKSNGDYQAENYGIFKLRDTADYRMHTTMLLKVNQNANAAFEGRLYKTVSNFSKNANIEIEHLSKKRVSKNKVTLVPMIILTIVASFLIINVALGLFGVLWYNINKRRAEIGLRRAVGASASAVSQQILGEALVLSTVSLIVGTFFAVQFPLLSVFDLPSGVYFVALVLAIIFIYILVAICALYPGKQAADIYPAVALHEE